MTSYLTSESTRVRALITPHYEYCDIAETAQSHGGSGIQDAVLAVPNDFTPDQRNAARYTTSLITKDSNAPGC